MNIFSVATLFWMTQSRSLVCYRVGEDQVQDEFQRRCCHENHLTENRIERGVVGAQTINTGFSKTEEGCVVDTLGLKVCRVKGRTTRPRIAVVCDADYVEDGYNNTSGRHSYDTCYFNQTERRWGCRYMGGDTNYNEVSVANAVAIRDRAFKGKDTHYLNHQDRLPTIFPLGKYKCNQDRCWAAPGVSIYSDVDQGELSQMLNSNEEVNVVEVIEHVGESRIRGKLENGKWVSLKHTYTGHQSFTQVA